MRAALSGTQEQWLGAGGGMIEAIFSAVTARGALVCDEGFEVVLVFDLLITVEGPRMSGDERLPVEESHGVKAGEQHQGALHVGVRDGVVVEIEAHVGGFTHAHLEALLGGERRGWQW